VGGGVFQFRSGAARIAPWAVGGALALGGGVGSALLLGSASAAAHTARVQIGTVSEGVFTSGTLSAVSTTNLGFQNGGTLAALYVNVGDTVKRGQVLAKEDTFEADQALSGAQAQLATNQSQLEQVLHDVTITQSRRILARDRDIQANTKRVEATRHSADEYAVRQAQKQLDTDERALQQAIAACEGTPTPAPPTAPAAPSSAGGLTGALASATSTNACSSDPTVQDDRTTVQNQKIAVRNAQYTERLDYLNGQGSIKSAGVTVAYDEAAVAVEVAHRPADIANARGAVTNQEAAVAKAQRDVDDTTLRAPVDGQVASIIGTTGENVPGGVPATPLSPGTRSQLPGVGRDPNSPGEGFMVLKPAHAFQMVVAVKQADVTDVKPSEQVHLHPDAIPDLHMLGTVLSVAPSGVNISGPGFYATVLLGGDDPRLRDGMTTQAAITTNTVGNVLVVPSDAVLKQGNATFVNVVGPDGNPVRTPFTAGASGFDNTQVLDGLQPGQQVLLP
jgi:HlyD family secretion protein